MGKKIEKIIKDFQSREKTLSFFGRNQYADWRVMLSIFFISFVLAMSFALFTYFNKEDDYDFFEPTTDAVAPKEIKKASLEKVIIRMDERKKNFEELKSGRPVVGDPSM